MKFNPISAVNQINETYRDYMKSTFYIKDEEFRDEYFAELDKLDFANGPYLECVDAFKQSKSLKQLVEERVLSSAFEELLEKDQQQYERALFFHQEQAIRISSADKNMIVTTGTGSGKTECFLYPIMNYLLQQEQEGQLNQGVRVLLLYPMNALANDQMQRLRQLLQSYPSITFGAYTGETEDDDSKALKQYQMLHGGDYPLENEKISRRQMKDSPPHILVTNYAMLEYLLIRPRDNIFFDDPRFNAEWKYIVLDEAHVYSGASGMEVSILMRRLIHRLPNSEKIRFILTSATLGGEDKNREILQFATSLCADVQFDADAIIRAKRRDMVFKTRFVGDSRLYQAIADLISTDLIQLNPNTDNGKEALLEVFFEHHVDVSQISASHNFQELLYEVFCHDSLYASVRRQVSEGAANLQSIIDACGVTDVDLLNFIQISSFAVKNRGKLLDARYHHFIRTLEGAYISLYPIKTLSLIPRKSVCIGEKFYPCYKLSVCQFCGELFLEGTISGDVFLQQEGEQKQYFMLIQPRFLEFPDDEDIAIARATIEKRKNTYRLCTNCGKVSNYGGTPSCSCNQSAQILLYRSPTNKEDGILHTCSQCKTTNPKGSVLRGFYLGQDASTAVVGEALYERIPETFTKQNSRVQNQRNPFKPNVINDAPTKTRRLLLFSDSRQEAAYFASYFQYTYNVILHRRIIMKAARNLLDKYYETYKEGIPILHLVEEMETIFSTILGPSASPASATKEVYKAIIGELKDPSRNSLHSIGWLEYRLMENARLPRQPYNEGMFSISIDQMDALTQFFLEYCMHHGALQIPEKVRFTADDWASFNYSEREPVIQKKHSGSYYSESNSRALVPISQNSVTEFLARVFPDNIYEHKTFLESIFDHYLTDPYFCILIPQSGRRTFFKINPEKIQILIQGYHPMSHFRCSRCGHLTTINIDGKCPSYRCDGVLGPYEFANSETKGYFINQYGIDAPIIPLTIKEHTAQLSKPTAQEYQQKFIDGHINILSCSTTFEMGVDVGDLETVFMKNMPPRPSNYIQRAGRAGRRLNSAAFSLTFCKLGPHDFYYYKRPTDMINGTICPPSFKIDNPKIVERHVFAVLLSYYWRKFFADKNQIQDLLSGDSLNTIIHALDVIPDDVIEYLHRVVPITLREEIENYIREYTNDKLQRVSGMYQADVEEYSRAYQEEDAKLKKNHDLLKWLSRVQQKYQQEQVLSFYSRNNLIPKYGFPVDTVTLFTDAASKGFKNDNSKLSLQRDLTQAISEYAPDSEVVADGLMFRSRYIKKPRKHDTAWRQYLVKLCENQSCNKIIFEKYVGQLIKGKQQCTVCGSHSILPQIMIVPEDGFIIEPMVERVTTKRPMKTFRTEFYYLGVVDDARSTSAKRHSFNNIQISVISSPDDKLLVMNKSEFVVCESCGYAEKSPGIPFKSATHSTPQGNTCPNTSLVKRTLGHTFKTDVALVTVNRKLDRDQAITIMYALLEGCSRYFDIERDDIDGCISYQSYASEGGDIGTTFVLFDSVPGGAGNVKQLYDADYQIFVGFLQNALARVRDCRCGNEGDTVCYSCLCNFKNQHYQERMQRRYAIKFLQELLESYD